MSSITKIPVKRDVAMTGEVTLTGQVLAIGGLKEKLLAALRSGIKKVIIPKDNQKDLEDIPDNVKKKLKIIATDNIFDVLKESLVKSLTPIKWKDEDLVIDSSIKNANNKGVVRH